ADGSHAAADLATLLERARAGADLVIGSRYVRGGGVRDWGRIRRLVSRAGCWYARRVLGLHLRDATAGLKCFRGDALERIGPATLRSRGYAFHVELKWRAVRHGLRVEETPIVFAPRRSGRSKMTPRIAMEAAWMVPALRLAAAGERVRRRRRPSREAAAGHS
ncbi:MAG: hypothetical protein AVDCRST_MAG69-2055, partial [uncultured Solirubrobacteraceae bacterium]